MKKNVAYRCCTAAIIVLLLVFFTGLSSVGTCSEASEEIPVSADLNGDGIVDEGDYDIIKAVYGTCSGDEGFVSEADYNNDGCITFDDHVLWVQAKENTLE